ncbi:hypothetical protein DPEC_G00137270 [Dallia pectoralis]|uniref:Uncharacterized protein n=1 Tax=Dallia pectoralis TaxID=75939 RepID=A0ACC2GLJ2_DALPE|nr:hypothetical protein DPEC_G00137270 [Dallia pectoralis]
MLGLQPGPVQMELQRRVRREPGLSFQESYREAKAMEKEAEPRPLQGKVDARLTYSSPQVTLFSQSLFQRHLRGEAMKLAEVS